MLPLPSFDKKLINLKFNLKRKSTFNFIDRFKGLVCQYNRFENRQDVSEYEKRDWFYKVVILTVPDLQSVDFLSRRGKVESLNYGEIKSFINRKLK